MGYHGGSWPASWTPSDRRWPGPASSTVDCLPTAAAWSVSGCAPPASRRAESAIYFVHGSGYALCSPRTHRRLTAWLSRLTGLPVFTIDYRLAPRHRFPTAADDVRAGWDWLTGRCRRNTL